MAVDRGCVYALVMLAGLAVMPLPAHAQETHDLSPLAHGRIVALSPPSGFLLDNGTAYTFGHIRIPAAMAAQAQQWLDEQTQDAAVALSSENATPDRHGRIAVEATATATGTWLQAGLVAQGLAWVDIPQNDSPLDARLLVIEDSARTSARGLWADRTLGLHTPDTLGGLRNAFVVVTGRALDVSTQKDVIYINYGRDWKSDFTLRLTRDAAKAFPRDFAQRLKDTPVRVRGWVYERNGPMIDLTHPAQIELMTATESTPPR